MLRFFLFKDDLVEIDGCDETRHARLKALTVVPTGSSLDIHTTDQWADSLQISLGIRLFREYSTVKS